MKTCRIVVKLNNKEKSLEFITFEHYRTQEDITENLNVIYGDNGWICFNYCDQ